MATNESCYWTIILLFNMVNETLWSIRFDVEYDIICNNIELVLGWLFHIWKGFWVFNVEFRVVKVINL